MINTFYSNTSYVAQSTEFSSFEHEAHRNPGATANEALLARLAKNVPGLKKDDVTDLASNDFSPNKVAERIAKFVALGLENARSEGRSEEEIQSKFDAAMQGVQKGFDEAREILDNLNLLTADISTTIDETEELTFKALEALNPSQSSSPSLPVYHTQVAAVERYSQAESFSLELETQDGDKVKIQFANQSSSESAFAYSGDDQGNRSAVYSLTQSQSSAFQFQVQGDLDEDELEAIAKLINDVSEISNEFFNGDVQKAFEIATQFNMDKTELASMNLQLTQSQSYSAAASYRSVEQNSVPDIGKLAGHFLNNIDQATQRPELDFLQNITDVSQRLLDSLVQQDSRFIDGDDQQQSTFAASLSRIKDIIESMQQQEVNDVAPSANADVD